MRREDESPEERLARLNVRQLPPASNDRPTRRHRPAGPAAQRAPPPTGEGDYRTTAIDEDDTDREERDLNRRIVEAPILARDPEPERKWIVEDVIPDETLTLMTGEGGIGKTTLALQLAVDMRIDGEWLGMKVAQGAVLFVTSEDDRKDVNLNLRAILKAEGKSLAHCPDLHILSLADRDACLAALIEAWGHRRHSALERPRQGRSNGASRASSSSTRWPTCSAARKTAAATCAASSCCSSGWRSGRSLPSS